MRYLLFAVFLLAPVIARSADVWRTFTDLKGRTMEAKVLKVELDSAMVELKAGGRQVPLSFDTLSKEDVRFLKNFGKPAKPAKPGKGDIPGGAPEGDVLYPRTKEEIRDGIRKIEKYKKPDGISKEIHDATTQLNIYRFLCGVPFEVEADAAFSKGADEAAEACKKNGSLSHELGHSTNKCNLSTNGNMVATVAGYIEDSGDNNRDARGHRAWCLNPPMQKTGFGSCGDAFSAMWCFDTSGKKATGTWAYPGKGLFPLEYLHGDAWSLYGLGKLTSVAKLKVQVFRLATRPEKPFADTDEIPGRELKINHLSVAMNGINFEPDGAAKRGFYWVRVRGGDIRAGYLVELF